MTETVRADSLRTRRELARVYRSNPSGRFLIGGLAAAVGLRAAARSWSPADAAVAGVAMVLVAPIEWAVHRHLFHSPPESIRRRRLGFGTAHERHHVDPEDVAELLLRPAGAVALWAAIGALSASWARPVAALFKVSAGRSALTAATVGWAALARYEWLHLLFHSRYRPRSARVRKLVANHRRHHHRDADRWFGVTTTVGDRLFGTS